MNKHWTVIIVEDTFDDVELISTVLTNSGIEIHLANNGEECLSLVETIAPTVIITDLAMPQMDGWELLEALRANPQTAQIPVIAISAYYSGDLIKDAAAAGFVACLPKPVRPRKFVEQIAAIIE